MAPSANSTPVIGVDSRTDSRVGQKRFITRNSQLRLVNHGRRRARLDVVAELLHKSTLVTD